MAKQIAFVLICSLCWLAGHAQKENYSTGSTGLAKLLGGFSAHVATGTGFTFYNHKIAGPGILQKSTGEVFLFDNFYVIGSDTLSTGYKGWVNNAEAVNDIPITDEDYLLGTDTTEVKYKGTGISVPLSVFITYTYDRYRFGGGFTYEQMFTATYYPNTLPNNLKPFKPEVVTASMLRYYGYVGGEVFRSLRHTIAVDAMVGTFKYGKKKFNPDQVKYKLFVNVGVSFERSLSEYFKVFIRPAVEFKSYELAVPGLGYTVNHVAPALYVNVGAILRMPELKKCPVSQCNTQINHRHGDKIYRSKMHPFWKWQNPNYGQNYPQLIKYKGKNKKKKNPY